MGSLYGPNRDGYKQAIIYFVSHKNFNKGVNIGSYNIISNEFRTSPNETPISNQNYGFIMQRINNKLHIILGDNNDKHYLYDIEKEN